MKRLTIICVLLMVGVTMFAQKRASYSNFHYGAAKDSMTIVASDQVYGISIAVPSTATDSVEVWGNAKTIDGKAASYVSIGPGEYYNSKGEVPVNYLYIYIRAGSSPRIATSTPVNK